MRFPRVLVLSGLAFLAARGGANEAVPAEGGKPAAPGAATTANNDLAFDLYARLAGANKDESLFFSPYSILGTLAVAAEGARAETAEEMGKALRLPRSLRQAGAEGRERPWDFGPIHAGLAALNQQFEAASRPPSREVADRLARLRADLLAANEEVSRTNDFAAAREARRLADEINAVQARLDRYEVRVANALWAEKSYPFRRSYLDAINRYYGAAAFPVDFRGAHEAARGRINAWAQKQTRDRIKGLVPPAAVDEYTRLVITNAIYFQGQWVEPFKEGQTKPRDFTLAGGKKVKSPTMHAYLAAGRYAAFNKDGSFFATPTVVKSGTTDAKLLYPGEGGFEVLEMPYKGGELSMVVLAPRSAGGLAALEKLLTSANLEAWLGKVRQRPVEAFLPKFRLESSFDLKGALTALGMKRAFNDPRRGGGAQFDGMSEAIDPDDKLYVSAVLHKAFVEVGEKGTEAAAATAVLLQPKKAADEPKLVPFTPTFRADKPFVFLIRDQKTGTVLFLGRTLQPRG